MGNAKVQNTEWNIDLIEQMLYDMQEPWIRLIEACKDNHLEAQHLTVAQLNSFARDIWGKIFLMLYFTSNAS
jgi:hypothetical protein